MKKPSKKTLKNKADKLWSEIIRSKGKCEVCGITRNLQSHHIEGRRNLTLRFDLRNGVCLCPLHHTLSSRESAHQSPLWFQTWLTKNRRADLNYLFKKRLEINDKIDYEEVLKELNEAKKQLLLLSLLCLQAKVS